MTTTSAWWAAARLWVVTLVFVAVGVARSEQVGIPFRDPHGQYLVNRPMITVGVALTLVLLDGVRRTRWPRTPGRVWSTLRTRWTPGRVALVTLALAAYHVTYAVYHNLKSWNDLRTPRDSMLARWDEWLFLGHSPAGLLHDLFGQQLAAWVLTGWYEFFATVVVVAFPAAVVLPRRMSDAHAGIAAFVWVWILGTATYYMIPSIGPFHLTPEDFAGLPSTVIQEAQERYVRQREELIADPGDPGSFAQLGAFASLHVGVTVVVLGLAWWHRLRWTTWALVVFLAGTMVATVYLGWHYSVDVPAGLAIGVLAWWLGPLTVGVRRRPADGDRPRAARSRRVLAAVD